MSLEEPAKDSPTQSSPTSLARKRPASERKIQANRRNELRSTGPKAVRVKAHFCRGCGGDETAQADSLSFRRLSDFLLFFRCVVGGYRLPNHRGSELPSGKAGLLHENDRTTNLATGVC